MYPRQTPSYGTVVGVDDEAMVDAARGLQAILDAADRGELTVTSLDELELLLRIEGAVEVMRNCTISAPQADDLP